MRMTDQSRPTGGGDIDDDSFEWIFNLQNLLEVIASDLLRRNDSE